MPEIILYQPEIPPNTGNVIRLAANTGFGLHLVEPLGFALDDARLRRAGLDYHEYARLHVWPSLAACLQSLGARRCYALTTRGTRSVYSASFRNEDALLFGCETRGLPPEVLEMIPPEQRLRLPMRPDSRSLNLSNAVAVVAFEAWRQLGFDGSAAAH